MKAKVLYLFLVLFILSCCSAMADNDVQLSRDDKGVWFVTGPSSASMYDVFEVCGYAVAQDRLWQAELFRRTARGQLAEIFGGTYLDQDILVRTTGYSDQELSDGFAALDEVSQQVITGYVAGFNRRINEIVSEPTLLPYEFAAVGQQLGKPFIPHAWTPEDVLAWMSLMLRNFDPEAQAQGQLSNAQLLQTLSQLYPADAMNMFNDLRWVNDPDALTYIHSSGAAPTSLPSQNRTTQSTSPGTPPLKIRSVPTTLEQRYQNMTENLKRINAHVKMGSYAWAVAGSKTRSGNPILYSGPQMGFTVPSIILEGSIRAGGLNVSGMGIAGIPGIVIGRTPHHAWSMQVGHAHTVDYYFVTGNDIVSDLTRTEVIKVAGQPDVTIPVYQTQYGPVVEPNPYTTEFDPATYQGLIVAWRYAHRNYEFKTVKAYIDLAKAQSMDEFAAGIENVAVSQHFTYADRDGNIAYWMSGRDPERPSPGDYRLPQGAIPGAPILDWDDTVLRERSTSRNTSKGYYCGWNNKSSATYPNSPNNLSYFFGPFHRAHVIDEYLSDKTDLTFDQVRNLALNIATTDSFGNGGNPWHFVKDRFISAVQNSSPTKAQTDALSLLSNWDGHFVQGGGQNWATGTDRPDAWMLADKWIKEVIDLTFADELAHPVPEQRTSVLFNVLLHALDDDTAGLSTSYDWFSNAANPTAPQTADQIIIAALDTALTELGTPPWGVSARGTIPFNHDIIGQVHTMPFSSRSTYAHCVEMSSFGPVRIESMFPLGESGDLRLNPETPLVPVFDANFLSMTSVYDGFAHRGFPLFDTFNKIKGQISTLITGQETDILGAVITIAETGQVAVTDSSGNFEIPDVPAGTYSIIIEKPGFTTITLDNVVVQDGEAIEPNIGPMAGLTCTPGDSNGDGILGIEDAIRVLQTVSGQE